MRENRDEGAKELFGYESDRTTNLLICMNCLKKSFIFQLPQNQWNAYSANRARMGNKLLSELVLIESNSKLSLCIIDVLLIVTLTVIIYSTIGVWKFNVINYNTLQVDRSLLNFSPGSCLCPRGVWSHFLHNNATKRWAV